MRTKSLVLLLACILLGAVAACGGKPKETPGPTASGGASAPAAPATKAPGVEAHLEKYAMGYDIGPSGGVGVAGATFGKGEKAFVSFAIADAKPKSQARVVWVTKPGGATVSEEAKPLPEGGGVVSFAADTKAWAIGDYSLQVFVIEPGEPGPRQLGGSDLSVKATRAK